MRYKMLALILALTVVSWAQTATQTTPSIAQQSTVPADKAKCGCCDKMAAADSKDAHAFCAHHDMQAKDGKEMASCCAGKDAMASGGKDAMSCMKNDKDKASAPCCKEACSKDGCGKDSEKGCCSGKKTEKTAKSCCAKETHS